MNNIIEKQAAMSESLGHDSFYKLPDYVQKFINKFNEGQLHFLPQTINRTVNLFDGNVLICKISYDKLENVYAKDSH